MDLQLNNKIIIVTGGAKGIGEGIVRVLAEERAIPVIIGRSEVDNVKLVGELSTEGKEAFQVTCELNFPKECEKAVRLVKEKFGRIDGVVNNAGHNDGVGLENGNYERFIESLHKNVVHYYLMVHHALPELIKTQGAVEVL